MKKIILFVSLSLIAACSAVKTPMMNHYKLTAYSTKQVAHTSNATLLITPSAAMDGYETDQMRYSTRPYTLNSYTKNNWFSPPAAMLYPLLIQSLQRSGYFYAVGSGAYFSKTTYRLDTQLIELQQNFIKKPSVLELKVKAVLTRVEDNQIIASKTFNQDIPCPQDTPYGGAIAANQATRGLTRDVATFVIKHVTMANAGRFRDH